MKELILIALTCTLTCVTSESQPIYDEANAVIFMDTLNIESAKVANKGALAEWEYASNLTEENKKNKLKINADNAKFTKEQWMDVIKFSWKKFKDENLKRQFKKYSLLGSAALPEDKRAKLEETIGDMESTYSTAKICGYKSPEKCSLALEPDLTEIMSKSTVPEELQHVWKEWRDASGKKCRKQFADYVKLSNEAAVLNNFTDNAAYWIDDFEDESFPDQINELWKQVQPLYLQLHAYVRRQLWKKYGSDVVQRDGPIRADLLGNMWAQTWSNIFDITKPFPNVTSVDVTPEMVKQGYTPLKMFKLSEEFFTSLNLSAMPKLFWEKSILEKPQNRELVCHASAWDFYDSKDFRIKQCTTVNKNQLVVAHHEMGHVQYYLQYKDQPYVFREGANSGFHEAVGDTIALSVSTPSHLEKIGLLKNYKPSEEATINQLYFMALDKVAFLPFGYMIDQWRWDVFRGKTTEENYNCNWWKLRQDHQGLQPPVDRSENDFDPGAKYHIISDVPYIRYFVSFIIQFQFHKSLCEKAGQFDPKNPEAHPLHECDIYKSAAAGNVFGDMLKMGSSKPWPDAMEVITGQRKMDASALLEYFAPLYKWLTNENKHTNEYIGWKEPLHKCKP